MTAFSLVNVMLGKLVFLVFFLLLLPLYLNPAASLSF